MNSTLNSKKIETLLSEKRIIKPSANFVQNALISSSEQYEILYKESIENPQEFWGKQGKELLSWFTEPESVLSSDWKNIGKKDGSYLDFFSGATLNASYNCIDRHVLSGKKDKVALYWQGENKEESREITYGDLLREVSKCAQVLTSLDVKKGDRVTIFMPMIPEVVFAVLACARIGAVHSVVFSAFSSEALSSRINDADASVLITANASYHAGKVIDLKEKVDQALNHSPGIKKVLVFKRNTQFTSMREGRDIWWDEASQNVADFVEAVPVNSEDPLFLLYTSGSTGKPKGVLHTTAGYLLYTNITSKYIFDLKEDDIFWCTADIGWITGHSYLVYGPLSNGASCIMFEGVPTYPEANRFWEIIEKYKVSVFYTAPTAIRALMKLGNKIPEAHDLSSLRLLGSVGEPINPEAWMWYYSIIGKEKCPVVDTWWQTETGGIMITTLPGVHDMKPGSAGKPFFGVLPEVVDTEGKPTQKNEGGSLLIKSAWPGMLRGVFGDSRNELIKNVYFSAFPESYFSADGARIDEDGYYWLLGRIDDVINVSGHRLATAEIESALVSHTSVAEAAVVAFPHEIKGQGIYCYVTLKNGFTASPEHAKELREHVRTEISPIATPDHIHFASQLPKTRSGKIMRRILRKIAEGNIDQLGDISTLSDPAVVEELITSKADL